MIGITKAPGEASDTCYPTSLNYLLIIEDILYIAKEGEEAEVIELQPLVSISPSKVRM